MVPIDSPHACDAHGENFTKARRRRGENFASTKVLVNCLIGPRQSGQFLYMHSKPCIVVLSARSVHTLPHAFRCSVHTFGVHSDHNARLRRALQSPVHPSARLRRALQCSVQAFGLALRLALQCSSCTVCTLAQDWSRVNSCHSKFVKQ